MNPAKLALARTLDRLGLGALLLAAQRRLLAPHVRVLNYHDVPPSQAQAFEEQVRSYAERFVPVGPEELAAVLRGDWKHARPGLLISFDDGLRSHADVAAPILERHGFPGWFFAPIGFVDEAPARQAGWARAHQVSAAPEYPDPRLALSWDDVRRLDRRHVVGCHTWDHTRLAASVPATQLAHEIVDAKRRLEQELGHEVTSFCWVGGEEESYSAEAARLVREAGFRFGFMTNNALVRPGSDPLQIQRTNVEATDPPEVVAFQLSGLMDVLYTRKRRRVNALTR